MANETARSLRKRQTIAEQRLWDELKLLKHEGYHFRRQAPIGSFIVDFACYSPHLVIEVDGVQHDLPIHAANDVGRDTELRRRGFVIMRVRNGDVMEKLDGLMREIWSLLEPSGELCRECFANATPHPFPLPTKGEGDDERDARIRRSK